MPTPDPSRVYNVLFLCTGNSARSILGEALVNKEGSGRFRGFSAGSQPKGQVHPMALDVLTSHGFPTEGLRSKSWQEFAAADAPKMDFIFTVCDSAAGETCPVWPGNPVTANWGIDDPAAVEGEEEQRAAFVKALVYLKTRFSLFTALPLDTLDQMTLQSKLRKIGGSEGATPASVEAAH